MRKISLLLAIVAFVSLFSTNSAQAQTDKQNAVKLGLLSPAVATGTIFYQRAFSEMMSAEIGFSYTSKAIAGDKFAGPSVLLQFNLHPSQEGIAGFHVSPYLRWRNWVNEFSYFGDTYTYTYSFIEGGVVIGYQWVFGDLITLDMYGGPGYVSVKTKYEYNGSGTGSTNVSGAAAPFDGFGFRFGVTLGVAF